MKGSSCILMNENNPISIIIQSSSLVATIVLSIFAYNLTESANEIAENAYKIAEKAHELNETLNDYQNTPCLTFTKMTLGVEDGGVAAKEVDRPYFKLSKLENSEDIIKFLRSRKIEESGLWTEFDVSSNNTVFELFLSSSNINENKKLFIHRYSSVIVLNNLAVPIKNLTINNLKIKYKKESNLKEKVFENLKPDIRFNKTVKNDDYIFILISEIFDNEKYLLCNNSGNLANMTNYDRVEMSLTIENMYGEKFDYDGLFEFNGYATNFKLTVKP